MLKRNGLALLVISAILSASGVFHSSTAPTSGVLVCIPAIARGSGRKLALRGGSDEEADEEDVHFGGRAAGTSKPTEIRARRDGFAGEQPPAEETAETDAMGKWSDVTQALEDMKREVKVHIETPDIPDELAQRLFACTHVQVLVITGALEHLPTGIEALRELTTLIISGNALTSLPSQLASLPNLRVLEAEDNAIEALPGQKNELLARTLFVWIHKQKINTELTLKSACCRCQ